MLQRAKSFIGRPKPPPDIYDGSDSSHLRRNVAASSAENLKEIQEMVRRLTLDEPRPREKKKRSLSFRVRRKPKTDSN
jgi:hypothetical protein